MSTTFSGWLLGLGEEGLAEVLRLRTDARSQPAPATAVALADRLSTRHSILLALATIDRASMTVTEAVLANGGSATMDDLTQLVAVGEDGSAGVRRCLDELTRRAILIDETNAHGARQWRAVGSLHQVIPQPLGLGGSLAHLLGSTDPRVLAAMAATLGVAVGSSPAATRKSLIAVLTPDRIRECVAQAPDPVRRYLDVALYQSPVLETSEASALYYPGHLRAGTNPVVWAALHGLLLPIDWGLVAMPREVALALRHGSRLAVTLPAEPVLSTVVVGADDVMRESRAAASAMVELVTALGDYIARSPVAALKNSGVGVREVKRLAKVHAADEAKVGFALQLAGTAGLLSASGAETVPLHAYEGWRVSSPTEQLAVLVRAWWMTDDAITDRFDHNGKALAPLAFGAQRPDARVMRSELVRVLHELPGGAGAVGADPVVDRLLWSRPLAYPPGELGVAAGRAAWFEAEQLGVVARGALTDLGRALLEQPVDGAVTRAAAELMPAAVGTATLQADLTALVAGTPTAGLAATLDGLAERESRGHATMWRFSPASIRRAMDAGETADAILDALRSISAKTLPQPLDYLVRDVARRHGHLKVTPVGCCVLADDPALLQEIASTRSLASLKPRVLAPTVLAVTGPVTNALDSLRAAGFAPVQISATGELVVTKVASRTMAPHAAAIPQWIGHLQQSNRRAAPPADPTELAQAILRGPGKGAQPRANGSKPSRPSKSITPTNVVSLFDRDVVENTASTEGILAAHAAHLTDGERALLAFAIVEDAEVHIEYRDANGKRTERVISEIELTPPFLEAWCHLREDDRMFSLAGILSVAPT